MILAPAELTDDGCDLLCVPEDDGGNDEVQRRRPVLLGLGTAVVDTALGMGEDRIGQGRCPIVIAR